MIEGELLSETRTLDEILDELDYPEEEKSQNEWKLIPVVVSKSESEIWKYAKIEWDEVERYLLKGDEEETCARGHEHIKERQS